MEPMELEKAPPALSLKIIAGKEPMARFGALLDQVFPVPQGSHFLEDFPVWGERNSHSGVLRVGAFDAQGNLAACAAARLAEFSAAPGIPSGVSVGVIGAVATRPEFRGRGLASRLVDFLSQWLEGQGAAFAVLWGSEHDLYRRIGFELCGAQRTVPLAQLPLNQAGSARVEIIRGWDRGIFPLLKSRPGGLRLQALDLSWLEAHRNVEWIWARRNGVPIAYAACGRGIDLEGLVHEWGGERAALEVLLREIRDRNPEAALLGPTSSSFGEGGMEGHLCLARILDVKRLSALWGEPRSGVHPAVGWFGEPGSPGVPLWFWGLDSG